MKGKIRSKTKRKTAPKILGDITRKDYITYRETQKTEAAGRKVVRNLPYPYERKPKNKETTSAPPQKT